MRSRILTALAALLITASLAFYGVFELAEREQARDIQILQSQMSLVADSRADAVRRWLQGQYEVLTGLAQNASVQIYIRLIDATEVEPDLASDSANRTYLRNLLELAASRSGFQPPVLTPNLPANVKPLGGAGIALVDPKGTAIVATSGMPPIAGALADFLARLPAAEPGLLDLYRGSAGRLELGLTVPVLAQEEDQATSVVIARVLGVRQVGDDLFETLIQPGSTAKTAESYLIRRAGSLIEYLTPLRDGTRPLTKRLAIDTKNLLDGAALADPGRFHAGVDYSAQDAFAVSRRIPGTDWVLVHTISRAEALAAADARRTAMVSSLTLAIVLISAGFIIVWRYATSLRAEEAARRYRESFERFAALSQFLDILVDSQPLPIFVADDTGHFTFGNQRVADLAQVSKDELPGHSLIGMLGCGKGTRYKELNRQVLETGQPITEISRFSLGDGDEQVWRSYHALLPKTGQEQPKVLTSIEDLTDLIRERARRERNTQQLIEALVGLVDERDPDAAHQSRYVAIVARQIAEEMGLDDTLIETTAQAARLVNIGKIRVPRSLLTKADSVTDAQLQIIRQALDEGPVLLQHISFDGPVLETLRQISERVDGSGRPLGLRGDQILPSAQAVALANTFVALVSPRAFRDGKSIEEAEAILLEEIGRRFDKRAVLSLLNYLSNKGGREAWASLIETPAQPAGTAPV